MIEELVLQFVMNGSAGVGTSPFSWAGALTLMPL